MKIVAILHTTFLTSDLLRARHFYEHILGLTVDSKRPQMSYDGVWYDVTPTQQIHLMALPDPEIGLTRPAHGGRDRHVAVGIDDLPELLRRMQQHNIAYTTSSSGRDALFCRDPDGNALEFIAV